MSSEIAEALDKCLVTEAEWEIMKNNKLILEIQDDPFAQFDEEECEWEDDNNDGEEEEEHTSVEANLWRANLMKTRMNQRRWCRKYWNKWSV